MVTPITHFYVIAAPISDSKVLLDYALIVIIKLRFLKK